MELVRLPSSALKPGQRLQVSLRDASGKLLFSSGSVLPDSDAVHTLIAKGAYTQAHEADAFQREMTARANTLVHQGASLGDIARVQVDFAQERPRGHLPSNEKEHWEDIQLRTHAVLRDQTVETFLARLEALRQEAVERLLRQPDLALMLLIHDAGQLAPNYAARHALLCMSLLQVVAKRLNWSNEEALTLTRAAFTMNLSLGQLQDRLAQQREGLSREQLDALAGHGDRSAETLTRLGVQDPEWLEAIRLHHDTEPGPIQNRPEGSRLARMLQRVDVFAAMLSPRAGRKALSGAQAARSIFLDEKGQQDEAGAALVKAVGLYPPGTFVRLASGEEGIVVKRGAALNEPGVAVLIGRSGTPLTEPVLRDTRLASQAVVQSLAPADMRVRTDIDKLLRVY